MSDRHEKWVKVEPGTIIPAGRPYRVEFHDGQPYAQEFVRSTTNTPLDGPDRDYYVDSSWPEASRQCPTCRQTIGRPDGPPPLELPTEPGSVIEATIHGLTEPRLWMLDFGGYWTNMYAGTAVKPVTTDQLTPLRVLFDAGAER